MLDENIKLKEVVALLEKAGCDAKFIKRLTDDPDGVVNADFIESIYRNPQEIQDWVDLTERLNKARGTDKRPFDYNDALDFFQMITW